MRVKSSVLFGLIALLCVISGVSVYKQLREVHDSWQPSDMYTGLKGMRSRTYSSVSYGNGASSDAPVLSLGARSMSGHNAAFSYAHAPASPVVSMGSTSSYGQSAVAGGNPVYATSNAEVRSFGGGGNGGGSVSMSGGVAKSSGSGAGSSVSLGVSTPSAPILAVNNNRNTNNQILPNISGEVVANPVATYAGIGNTTGGASRGLGGRHDAPPSYGGDGDPDDNQNGDESGWGSTWLNWLDNKYAGMGNQAFTWYQLEDLYGQWRDAYVKNNPGAIPPTIDEWMAWFYGTSGDLTHIGDKNEYTFLPIGDIIPILVMALMYIGVIAVRRYRKSQLNIEN
jgi:hypothetical protein